MKRTPLNSVQRFLSLLILDEDIIEHKDLIRETIKPQKSTLEIHPIFTQDNFPIEKPIVTPPVISIRPKELGEKEMVETTVFPFSEETIENNLVQLPETLLRHNAQLNSEEMSGENTITFPIESEASEQTEVKIPRSNETFVSLRDVLLERGNFWEDKMKAEEPENVLGNENKDLSPLEDERVMTDIEPVTKEELLIDPTILTRKNNSLSTSPADLILGISEDGQNTISLEQSSLLRHTLIVGQTGSGKTTLMERMILQDIESGRGVGLIDPHGDLYDSIVTKIPKLRSNDVVLFDLADVEYPIGFNILENTHEQFSSLVASSIVGVFKKLFGYSWGPRLEYILRNATLTLLEKPGSTLLDLTLLLTDEDFRDSYLKNIKNPFLQKFWSIEFGALSQSRQAEIVSPILNKVGQFLSVPLIRNIVSQPQSGFSPRWVMDNKKIFLANLSKGKIGEDVSDMFGSMLVSKFQLDVMSRASIAPADRVPFRLYVDEFQNFATESFSDIFSEARKYGMELIIAHQYLGQIDKKLTEAILGNVGNIIAFHTSNEDARILAPNMSKTIDTTVLTEQQHFSFVVKTVKDGKKFIAKGELIPPALIHTPTGTQSPEKLKNIVREKFAKKREFVEQKLNEKIIT